jgi:tRNA(His) guanylyltransferase
MNFDDLDKEMRVFETDADRCVLPDVYIVARIDGRNFTTLTKTRHQFVAPFDERFRDFMLQTVEHLMVCGLRIIYGYTQSDEISLLFHRDDDSFSRKTRKLNSILAGEASAKFSLLLGDMAAFDCRICELPNVKRVEDYFRWRQEDAHRNALSAHCYWLLRRNGKDMSEATTQLKGMNVSQKNELLFQAGINFNDMPAWQKRGTGMFWEMYDKASVDPRTQTPVTAIRRRIARNFELPLGDSYSQFIFELVKQSEISPASESPS